MTVDDLQDLGPRSAGLGLVRSASGKTRLLFGAVVLMVLMTVGYLYFGSAGAATIVPPERRPLAPDFAASSFSGGELGLSDLRGQPVVLNFWASWCPPCRAEARDLERVWQAYRDRGVVFVGVDIQDTENEARAFLSDFGVSYPNVLDARNEIATTYRISGIPSTFFVDREGRIASRRTGPLTEQQLVARVEELLQ